MFSFAWHIHRPWTGLTWIHFFVFRVSGGWIPSSCYPGCVAPCHICHLMENQWFHWPSLVIKHVLLENPQESSMLFHIYLHLYIIYRYVCTYICKYIYIYVFIFYLFICLFICIYIHTHIYIYIYICINEYIYIYIFCTHTHTYIYSNPQKDRTVGNLENVGRYNLHGPGNTCRHVFGMFQR